MSNNKPAHHITFGLANAKIAPLNPDGTYGDQQPIPTSSTFKLSAVSSEEVIFSRITLSSYTFSTHQTGFGRLWRVLSGGDPHSRKVQHAIARRRARALARQRGGA